RPPGPGTSGPGAQRSRCLRLPVQRRCGAPCRRTRRRLRMTTPLADLLGTEPRAVTAGVDLFREALTQQAVPTEPVEWRPPLAGTEQSLMPVMADPRRVSANARAVERMLGSTAELVDVRPARDVLGLQPGEFLHAGPPLTWERASGPMRGALIGAMLFEGLADTPEAAERTLARGDITLTPCHDRGAVGP